MTLSAGSARLAMNQALTQVEETKGNQLLLSVSNGPVGSYKSIFTQMILAIKTNEQINSC